MKALLALLALCTAVLPAIAAADFDAKELALVRQIRAKLLANSAPAAAPAAYTEKIPAPKSPSRSDRSPPAPSRSAAPPPKRTAILTKARRPKSHCRRFGSASTR